MSDKLAHGREKFSPSLGRDADSPREFTRRAWRHILKRVWFESDRDRIMLIAAGVTFYLLLALFPALAVFVSIYGFVADPSTIAEHIAYLGSLLPSGGLDLINAQIDALLAREVNALSFGFYAGLAVAFWSANNGVKALFDAMNVAYEETEKRSFIRLNLISFLFTLGAMAIGAAFLVTVGVVPALLAFLQLDGFTEILVRVLRWPVMLVMVAVGISLIYRYGPSRKPAKWRWLTWGAGLATVVWIVTSILFSLYLQNFANYSVTYGSLGAVVGFMMWVWISVLILIVGAELNAEMEHQTAVDTTRGEARPMGERGAVVADTVAGD